MYAKDKSIIYKGGEKSVMNEKTSKLKEKLFYLLYRTNNYLTYHQYKRSLNIATGLLMVALIFIVIGFFCIFFSNVLTLVLISNAVLSILIIYTLMYYYINAKFSRLLKTSKIAMNNLAFNGMVSESWHIYDGYFSNSETESVEIVFTDEKSYIGNIIQIFLKKSQKTLPLPASDISNLRQYLIKLTDIEDDNGKKIVAYGTVSESIAKQLKREGIKLTYLPKKYRCKPGRLNYANAVKDIKAAFWKYPSDFRAAMFEVDSKN